ncbi:PPK2 family polyphosphate:nucleotide phosphotransferase [Arthrobacter sp. JUb119]|uniref:PPK2 family polyphosphate kinase n=2 Tax=Micrococcales TaxID=85006 RepID=UPI000CFB5A00|nr:MULTISPECIES: PPK2 family polyphosphate kinase [unclassified Arthrobacter]MCS3491259.1 PPK2 family polyphosphate:nucleotide phosphotransferase [Arthrobacter sp. JUb119]PQZ87471.1 phosphate--nucleotide phosphotransferase [Arthrobacter sp. MYb222]PRB78730.1 phosphate--nucleotide phosphotransferase [Arthrobacter sp. MYb214]
MSAYPANLLEALRAEPGVKLSERATKDADWWPGDAPQDKKAAEKRMVQLAELLSDLQERLFAASVAGGQGPAVLLILQGMDTSGKGGTVRHVLGMLDPQGVKHHAFKAPTEEEAAHDFLWRITRQLPAGGLVGVFDRSHYEDVLVAKVKGFATPDAVESRYGKIVDFEKQLIEQGIHPIKVMLHISREEQFERLSARLERADKHWKYSPGDVDDRLLWDDFQSAYEVAINRTDNQGAPWHIVPADQKWKARLCVAELLLATLERVAPDWPVATFDVEQEKARLAAAK